METELKNKESRLLRVGITGEMGVGKTYICNLFAEKNVPIYNCDKNAKKLVIENKELIEDIKIHFGENIYVGNIYKNLSNIVFDERGAEVLKILSNLIHPYLYEDIDTFCEINKGKGKFCLIESAILFENNMEDKLDTIIYVTASLNIRKERAMKRDKITSEEYDIRMKTQLDTLVKMRGSQYIIYNNDNANMKKRVDDIFHQINYSHFHLFEMENK